jgi:hypothetical protein
MHGETIYDKTFDSRTAAPDAVAGVAAFRRRQQVYQKRAIEALERDILLTPDRRKDSVRMKC